MDEFFHRWMGPLHHFPDPLYRPRCCLLHRAPSSQSRSAARTGLWVPLPVPARTARPGPASWSSQEGPGTGRTGTGGPARAGGGAGGAGALPVPCSRVPSLPVYCHLMWKLPLERWGEGLRVCPCVSPRLCLTSVQALCAPRPSPRDAALAVIPSSGDAWWPPLGTWHRRAGEGADGASPGLERGWQG